MVQTATHIFILTLEGSGASAPRIRHGQEGTIRFTLGFAIPLWPSGT
jgi:hypothetical protein